MAINRASAAPVIWLLTDNKPGHRNQLKGLGNRLRVKAGASLFWINALDTKVPFWRALLAIPPNLDSALPHPDLIIAAGSGTHGLLLSLRRLKKATTLVLMKPGFPRTWISGSIIPAHDDIAQNRDTLITDGVINTITPLAKITDKPEALLLLGGPSPHFDWDDDVVFGQVANLMGEYPQWRWTISGSRRTPEAFRARLEELSGPRVTVVNPDDTYEDWLNHRVAASRAIWVTPDSMSMVCEAATSGVPTGLFQLPEHPGSRVASGVQRLVEAGYVARWSDHAAVMGGKTGQEKHIWEADRAANWVIHRWLAQGAGKKQNEQKRKTS
ncbi:mitochondrial fission ELM1 family protein [Marinobacter sp. 2_MG-2023]|uniref:mitochondrial fission ELM1 family protein n=1 Tax=Marinobacter sp. 2_MG-2023 TaxID=3062679 RepID=UPI0026E1E4EC|nr:ELM1/GtrOC1 family putative glycosyltransferase [Marinobacter sp. 2_MG-2023]MDO6443889.1 ELM1/GtrOC1 family putative glycosyltransferase [Marinobacter sp. 2_MG-2023]